MQRSWLPRRCFSWSGSAPSDGRPRLHRPQWRNRARLKASARERIAAIAEIGAIVETADEAIARIVASVAADHRAAAPTDPAGADHPIDKAAAEHHRGEDHHVEIATANERSERTIPSKRWMDRGHCGGHVQR